jgi:toxin ParE1/3/4
MASGVIWSPQALADLEATCQFIQRDSPRQAQLFAQRVIATIHRLALFPRSGRIVPEFGLVEYREVPVGSYRLIYRVEGEEVYILTIHHTHHSSHVQAIAPASVVALHALHAQTLGRLVTRYFTMRTGRLIVKYPPGTKQHSPKVDSRTAARI